MESITPFTRKEKYINQIVGGGNTAPETPQTREELFFAGILGEVVAPSPITRAEKYLAKIANKYSGELPEPVTRIERFIAKAAGMDVTIPTPITREEMFWADYALIVEKELSGIPPLTFNAAAGSLKNYRIYGNTVNGESVGDRTANLFNSAIEQGSRDATRDGGTYDSTSRVRTSSYTYLEEAGTYTINCEGLNSVVIYRFNENGEYIGPTSISGETAWERVPRKFTIENSCNVHFVFSSNNGGGSACTPDDIYEIQIVLGTDLPEEYEPYGYKISVNVSDGTDTQAASIYLDAPLAKSGNNADYIDYATQKRHNSDGTESSVTLPEIDVTAGTNTLTVGTEVQPSDVYIKYKGAR